MVQIRYIIYYTKITGTR